MIGKYPLYSVFSVVFSGQIFSLKFFLTDMFLMIIYGNDRKLKMDMLKGARLDLLRTVLLKYMLERAKKKKTLNNKNTGGVKCLEKV